MKKIFTLMKPVLLAALAVLFVTCGKKSGDYRNLIPRNSFVTISVNAGSMMDKAGFSQAERSAYRTQAEMMLGFLGGMLSADDKQFILSIIDSPDNSGLSFSSDMYLFVDADNAQVSDPSAGFVAKVSNKKKLDQFVKIITGLNPAGMTVRNDKGLDIVVINESVGNTAILAYDNNACIFYRSRFDYATTLREVAQLYSGGNPSLASDKVYDPFFSGKSDIGMLMSYGSLVKFAEAQGGPFPFADMLAGASMYLKTDFKKGSIDTDYGILFNDNESKKKYEEFYSRHEISGKFAHLVPEDALAAATGYLDGGKIYSALMKLPDFASVDFTPQLSRILGALEGDMLFAFTGMDPLRNDYRGILAATVNDPGVVDYIIGQLEGIDIRTEGENSYTVQLQNLGIPFGFWFGLHGDVFYIATDPVMVEAVKGKNIDHLKGEIHNKFNKGYGAFYLNINRTVGIVTDIVNGMGYYDTDAGPMLHFFTSFENMIAYADDPYKGKMIVNMVDKDANALQTMVSFIKDIAMNNMGGMMPF